MKTIFSILIIVAFFDYFGCKEKDVIYVETNPGNVKPGTIIGTVTYRPDYRSYETNLSGVRVNIVGTAFSTTSDANGKWILTDIPVGTYDINLTKAGFDTTTIFDVVFAANGTLPLETYTLYQKPTAAFISLTAEMINTSNTFGLGDTTQELFKINYTNVVNDTNIEFTLCLNNSPDVDYNNNKITLYYGSDWEGYYNVLNLKNQIMDYINYNYLQQYFKTGETVYLVAYPGAQELICEDYRTGYQRISSLGAPSPIASFLMK